MTGGDVRRALRWYPESWRSRYGAEMLALLEDTYGPHQPIPLGARLDLVRAGLRERAREAGFGGSERPAEERLRSAAVLVLCGWALFLVAGALFGKFTDNWFAQSPRAGRWIAGDGYAAVVVLGILGCALVAGAAVACAPSFVRFVRQGEWEAVRTPLWRAAGVMVLAGLVVSGGLVWAHHLGDRARNGGSVAYSVFFVLACLLVVAALGFVTAAAVAVARRLDLTPGVLRALGLMALLVCGLMVLLCSAVLVWWIAEAMHAPHVLRTGIGGGLPYSSATVPPALLGCAFLMTSGLVLAAVGARQVVRSGTLVG